MEKSVIFDKYDMLIIAPRKFSDALQPLIDHKNDLGIQTILDTTENIYSSYNGRDEPEEIKLRIKDAIEEWDITYVLLVGGRKQWITEEWFVPVRYVTFKVPGYRSSYICDLYFSDVYDDEGYFQSWDSDNDGAFGTLKDDLDCHPDVFLGRWPCRNVFEVKTMVKKTINYESNSMENKKIVLVGGDTFSDNTNYNEGELITLESARCLPDIDVVKVFSSESTVSSKSIRNALGDGALFMHFKGHGWVIYWNTYKNDQVWVKSEPGFGIWDVPKFSNSQYPIVLFGGCYTSMFNVSLFNHPHTWHEDSDLPIILRFFPAFESISWFFTRKPNGGGIAGIGYTGMSSGWYGESGDLDNDGLLEPDCIESGSGYMEINFFNAYGKNNKTYLGECWGYAEEIYINTHGINEVTIGNIQKFVLLGDPSLKIGGYR